MAPVQRVQCAGRSDGAGDRAAAVRLAGTRCGTKQWETDILINARGVAVDLDLVHGALSCSARVTQELTQEAVQISGLDNPNSVAQLSRWLEDETGAEVADLRKDTVARMLADGAPSEAVQRMLEIRQELGKTSNKKYAAMDAGAGEGGRVRGLLQFYGANRTGRWAGRLVQVQNLPRTHLPGIELARERVKAEDVDTLRMLYGSVPDTLSQLIRTALVPAPRHRFVDADFSAIEARVIAWLSGEEWVLDVFRTHGKIYEATASQMFGVPMERIKRATPSTTCARKARSPRWRWGIRAAWGRSSTWAHCPWASRRMSCPVSCSAGGRQTGASWLSGTRWRPLQPMWSAPDGRRLWGACSLHCRAMRRPGSGF